MTTTVKYNLKLLAWEGLPSARVQVGLYPAANDPVMSPGIAPLCPPFWVSIDPGKDDTALLAAITAAAEVQCATWDTANALDAQNKALATRLSKYIGCSIPYLHTVKG